MPETEHDVLEELASLPTFHHPDVSPDGERVAVYYDGSGRNELHLVDAETGEMRQVSDGEVPRNARWHLNWSADGDRLFFHLDEGGNEQNDVHAIDVESGEAEPVVEMDGQNSLQDVGDDGETLLVGSSAGGQMNLYVHDLPSGETTKVTDYDRAVWVGALSPDCDRIAYATNEADDYDNMDVYVADADGSNPRNLQVGETGAEAMPVDWGPDGEHLLVADNTEDLSRCGIYDLAADEVTWFGGDHEEQPVQFLPGGDRFLAVRTRDATMTPLVYDVEGGDARALDLPEGVASFAEMGEAAVDEDTVVLAHTTADRRPELLAYDLTTDETTTLVEAEYGRLDPDQFADAEFFTFESHGVDDAPQATPVKEETDLPEGIDIEALLYDPRDTPVRSDDATDVPAVVKPHGGPRGQDTRSFDIYTQFLVTQGYAVLEVNYRGSTGRGREFVELLYDDWGGDEQADVALGADILADHDWVDEDRVAVFGGSYGGYSAYWQMVQYPDRYAAGIAWIGLTDLEAMFEETMPHFRTELMEKYLGTPEDNPELYRDRSPVTHAENLDAPLLLLHGVNDRRVPVGQARLFRDAIDDLGYVEGEDADYEYVELGEEGHASSDIDQKIRAFRTLGDFLDRRL